MITKSGMTIQITIQRQVQLFWLKMKTILVEWKLFSTPILFLLVEMAQPTYEDSTSREGILSLYIGIARKEDYRPRKPPR